MKNTLFFSLLIVILNSCQTDNGNEGLDDNSGDRLVQISYEGGTSNYKYNADGLVSEITDIRSIEARIDTTTLLFEYNDLGRLIWFISHNNSHTGDITYSGGLNSEYNLTWNTLKEINVSKRLYRVNSDFPDIYENYTYFLNDSGYIERSIYQDQDGNPYRETNYYWSKNNLDSVISKDPDSWSRSTYEYDRKDISGHILFFGDNLAGILSNSKNNVIRGTFAASNFNDIITWETSYNFNSNGKPKSSTTIDNFGEYSSDYFYE